MRIHKENIKSKKLNEIIFFFRCNILDIVLTVVISC